MFTQTLLGVTLAKNRCNEAIQAGKELLMFMLRNILTHFDLITKYFIRFFSLDISWFFRNLAYFANGTRNS